MKQLISITKAISRNEVMYEIRNTMDGVFSNFLYLAVGFLTEISILHPHATDTRGGTD